MATKNPLKYENEEHLPFGPGDTLPASTIPVGELDACALLSPDPTNELECRDGKLYFGTVAPPNLANLYVSPSLGNDANAGSRNAPLATIAEAFRRHENKAVNYTIWLRSGESHVYVGQDGLNNRANLTLLTYDEPTYQDLPDLGNCVGYTPHLGAEYQRAQLVIDPYVFATGPGGTPLWQMSKIDYATVLIRGVNVHQRNAAEVTLSGVQQPIRAAVQFELRGGILDTSNYTNVDALITTPKAFLQVVNVQGLHPVFRTDNFAPNITHAGQSSAGRLDGCSVYPAYTPGPDNVRSVPLTLLIQNPNNPDPNVPTYQQFNHSTSWDPRV